MLKKFEESNSNSEDNHTQKSSYDRDDSQNYSNDDANSAPIPLEEDVDFFQMHGMFFCSVCNNLMQPYGTKGELLEFRCRRCGIKNINFKNRVGDKSLIYSKSLRYNSTRTDNDAKLMLDPSMPRINVICPECDFKEAVCMMAPQEGQRRIVLKLICARGAEEKVMKCGKTWDLEQEIEIEEQLSDGILSLKE